MTSALLLASLLASSAQADLPPQKYFLCIGTGAYRGSVGDLYGPDKDAEELGKKLESFGWKPITAPLVSRRGKDKEYRPGLPAREDILSVLKEAVAKCRKQDDFLFFFSGHGVHYEGSDILLPWDAAYEDEKLKLSSVISFENDLAPLFKALKSDRRIVILNMCRSEIDQSQATMSGDKGYDVMLPKQFRGASSLPPLLLWSCQRGEVSYAPEKPGELTLFGQALIDEIGKAEAQPTYLTVLMAEILTKVQTKTKDGSKFKEGPMTPGSSGFDSYLSLSLGQRPRPVSAPIVTSGSTLIDLHSFYVQRTPRNSQTAKLLINRSVTISRGGSVVSQNSNSWELFGLSRNRDGINTDGLTLWDGSLSEGETASIFFTFYAAVQSSTLAYLANDIGNISNGLIDNGVSRDVAIGVAGKIGEEYANKAAFKGVEGYLGTVQVTISRRDGKIVNGVVDTVAWGHGPLPKNRSEYWQGNPGGLPNGTDKFKLHAEKSNDAEIWFYFRNPEVTNN